MHLNPLANKDKKEIARLNSELTDRNVLIDTLRATLTRAKSVINEKDVEYVFTRASKWAMSKDLN